MINCNTVENTAVGDCPRCSGAIHSYNVLIEYEREDGHAAYAECPDCHHVVHPV